MARRLLLVAVAACVVACAGGGGAAPNGPDDFVVGGDRPATVRVPVALDPEVPAPLLIVLHGYGSSGSEVEAYLGLGDVADASGTLTVYPDGTEDEDGERHWNVHPADTTSSGVDDAAYLTGLVDEIGAVADVDPDRVYLLGHSNGAVFAQRMACDHADRFAAVVSVAGTLVEDSGGCHPTEPVTVLLIHGTLDDIISYQGGTVGSVDFPSVDETARRWLESNGCEPGLVDVAERLDLDRLLDGGDGPAETTVEASTGCLPGGHVEVWSIEGGGHVPDLGPAFAERVIGFLLSHPRS